MLGALSAIKKKQAGQRRDRRGPDLGRLSGWHVSRDEGKKEWALRRSRTPKTEPAASLKALNVQGVSVAGVSHVLQESNTCHTISPHYTVYKSYAGRTPSNLKVCVSRETRSIHWSVVLFLRF